MDILPQKAENMYVPLFIIDEFYCKYFDCL